MIRVYTLERRLTRLTNEHRASLELLNSKLYDSQDKIYVEMVELQKNYIQSTYTSINSIERLYEVFMSFGEKVTKVMDMQKEAKSDVSLEVIKASLEDIMREVNGLKQQR